MSKVFVNKKIMGLVMAAILLIGGMSIYHTQAAENVNLNRDITITAAVADGDNSVFASNYKGIVKIELYKIAAMDTTGKLTKTEAFNDEAIKLEVLETNNPSVDAIKENIATPALAIAEAEEVSPDKIISLDRKNGATTATVTISGGAGLYLYRPLDAVDEEYTYSFTSYVIMAPTSSYITEGSGSDAWQYDVSFNLKAEEAKRYGNLKIKKTLDTFNTSLGPAAFVYKVQVFEDDEKVMENVYSIDFEAAGTQEKIIENLPANATVIVTEVYTGASYDIVGEAEISDLVIVADDVVTASFENDYDGRQIQGGISAENQFEKKDGVVYWMDANGAKVQQ